MKQITKGNAGIAVDAIPLIPWALIASSLIPSSFLYAPRTKCRSTAGVAGSAKIAGLEQQNSCHFFPRSYRINPTWPTAPGPRQAVGRRASASICHRRRKSGHSGRKITNASALAVRLAPPSSSAPPPPPTQRFWLARARGRAYTSPFAAPVAQLDRATDF